MLFCINAAQAILDVRIVADIPKSLHTTDPKQIRAQLLTVMIQTIPDQSRAGIWLYGQHVNQIVPLQTVDVAWRALALQKIQTIKAITETNNLAAAIEQSTRDWHDRKNNDEKHLILLVDSNSSEAQSSLQYISLLAKKDVKIHVVAHSEIPDVIFYKKIVELTHGSWIHQLPSAMPEKITELMQEISHRTSTLASIVDEKQSLQAEFRQEQPEIDEEEVLDPIPPSERKMSNPLEKEPEFVYAPEYKGPIPKDESKLLAQLANPLPDQKKQWPLWLQQEEKEWLSKESSIIPPLQSSSIILNPVTPILNASNATPKPVTDQKPIVAAEVLPVSDPEENKAISMTETSSISQSEESAVLDVATKPLSTGKADAAETIVIQTQPETSIAWRLIEVFMLAMNFIVVTLFFMSYRKKSNKKHTHLSEPHSETMMDQRHVTLAQAAGNAVNAPAVSTRSELMSDSGNQPETTQKELSSSSTEVVLEVPTVLKNTTESLLQVESAVENNAEKKSEQLPQVAAASENSSEHSLQTAVVPQKKAEQSLQTAAVPEKKAEKLLQKAVVPEKNTEQSLQTAVVPQKKAEKLLQKAVIPEQKTEQSLQTASVTEKKAEKLLQKAVVPEKEAEKLLQTVVVQEKKAGQLLKKAVVSAVPQESSKIQSDSAASVLPQEKLINVENFLTENEPMIQQEETEDPLERIRRLGDTLQQIIASSPELISTHKSHVDSQKPIDLDSWISQQGKKE
jgi:hypothetical protein